jgi:prolyl-tRNA editing enzyme YbaK/EbsC (Cys-tRNA(Pro) deacylase)
LGINEKPGPETSRPAFFARIRPPIRTIYIDIRNTAAPARAVAGHQVIKTPIVEDEHARLLIVPMRGERKVSTKELACRSGRKHIEPCRPEAANRHAGYLVGGTSPFAARKSMPGFGEKPSPLRD